MAHWEVSSTGRPHAATAPDLQVARHRNRIAADHDSLRREPQTSIDDIRMMQDFEEMLRAMQERVGGGAVKSAEPTKGRRVCGQHTTEFNPQCGEVCVVCGLVVREIADMPAVFEERIRRERVDIVETVVGSSGSDEDEGGSSEDCRSTSSEAEGRWGEESAERGLGTVQELAEIMQPHQKDGYNFIWRNLGGDARSGQGAGGCILAHSPGTGKSLIVIAFMASYRKVHPKTQMLILAPLSMLYEWQAEFARWNVGIPFYILNTEEKASKEFSKKLAQVGPGQRLHAKRSGILTKWGENPGVLATTYHSLSNIIDDSRVLTGYAKKNRDCLVANTDVLVLDEGHIIRTKGKLRSAVLQVNTRKRVLLSGTLFQNNVQELRNLCYVVRPNCLDPTLKEEDGSYGEVQQLETKVHHFEENTTRVLRARKPATSVERLSPPRDKQQIAFDKKCKEMFPILLKKEPQSEERDREIRKWQHLTDPFVSSFDGKNLKNLRALYEYVIKVYPNSEQTALLATYIEEEKPGAMMAQMKTEKICIHPVLEPKKDELDKKAYGTARPEDGVKTHLVMQLVEQSILIRERVVIFCMQVEPLDLLRRMFEQRFGWVLLRDILMVDGKMDMEDRFKNLLALNNPDNDVKVILASTKAFAEGVSMVGASRVIHLGIEWNPSVNRQATCRAYRMGQKKDVHVYRLLACNTIEEAKYDAAISKGKLGRKILAPPDERWEGTVQMPSSTILGELDDPVLQWLTRKDLTSSIAQIVKVVDEPVDIAHVEDVEPVGQVEQVEQVGQVEQVEQFVQVEHLVYSALMGQTACHHQRELQLEPKIEKSHQSERNVQLQPKIERSYQSERNVQLEPKIEKSHRTERNVQLEPKIEKRHQSERNVQFQPKIEKRLQSERNVQLQPKTEKSHQSERNVQLQSKIEKSRQSERNVQLQLKIEKSHQSERNVQLQPKIEKSHQTERNAQLRPKIEKSHQSERNVQLQPKIEKSHQSERNVQLQPKIEESHQSERTVELQAQTQEQVRRPRGRPRKIIHKVSKEEASSPSSGLQEQVQGTNRHEWRRKPGYQPQRQPMLLRKRGGPPATMQSSLLEEGSSTSEGEQQESRKRKPDLDTKSQEKLRRPRGRPRAHIQSVSKVKATPTLQVEQGRQQVRQTAFQERRHFGFQPSLQTILPRKRGRPRTRIPIPTIWSEESSSTSEGEQESIRKWTPALETGYLAKSPGSYGRPSDHIRTILTSSSEREDDPPTERKYQDIIALTDDESEDESEGMSDEF